MMSDCLVPPSQVVDGEWIAFPGGELEGTRPRGLCRACRARARRPASRGPLCFQCYREGLERERAVGAAGRLDTASEARFQTALPFEPVDQARLNRLRAARSADRAAGQVGVGRYADRRRQAQIAARHALQRIAAGVQSRSAAMEAIHAAELQLPEAWVPFVVSR